MIYKLVDYSTRRLVPVEITETPSSMSLYFGYNKNLKDDIKGCEGSKWDNDNKCWTVKHPSISTRNKIVLGYLSQGNIPGTIKDPFKHLTKPIEHFVPNRPLKEHQQVAFNKCLTRHVQILGHDMGLGKTLVNIEIMEKVKEQSKDIFRDKDLFWVIAPKSPLMSWRYELKKWNSKVDPRLIVCDQQRIAEEIKAAKIPPKVLILDESSRFRNRTSKRTDYVFQLSELMREHWGEDCYIILDTGTPSPKDPTNWHAQVELIAPGFLKERDANQLRARLAHMEQQTLGEKTFNKILSWNYPEVSKLYQRLAPLVDIRFKKDCLDLPEKIYQEVELGYTANMLNAARIIIETNTSAAVTLVRLRQLSDGFMKVKNDTYDNPDLCITTDLDKTDQGYTTISTPKDEQLKNDLESLEEEDETRVVIFAGFTASVDKVTKICREAGWHVLRVDGRGWHFFLNQEASKGTDGKVKNKYSYTADQEQFQDKNLDEKIAFVANSDAGGMGITLTKSKIAIYYSNSFNAEARIQSEDRIYRIGSRGALIKDYFHLPTDKMILQNLKFKRDLQSLSMGQLASELDMLINEKTKVAL